MRLRRLEPVLRRALRGPCRLPRGSTLLVAVSGGADSTALLVALASLAREFDLSLSAAHLHHGLRGRDADADLAHVRALCARLGVPLEAARWDCRARMRRRALSGEAGLRTLRREWLSRVARRRGAAGIATAHTADDQLETLLLRLARGTGLTGAAGMRARAGAWIKPLLHATRDDVERDLERAGLAWREDASNASSEHARNRVRHAVVPALLDALGAPPAPAARRRAALARRAAALARELAGAESLLARATARACSRMLHETSRGPALRLAGLARLAPALRRLVLHRAWRVLGPAGPAAPGLTARHLAAIATAADGHKSRFDNALPDGWRAVACAGSLRFEPPGAGGVGVDDSGRRAGATDARLHHRPRGVASRPPAGRSRHAGTVGPRPVPERR